MKKVLLAAMLLFILVSIASAQGPGGPPPPSSSTGAPIDGAAGILLASALAYGVKKLRTPAKQVV